jgi:hypothetical protein
MSLYWRCQLVGWSLYALMGAGIPTLYGGLRGVVIVRAAAGALLGAVLTDLVRRHMRRRAWDRLSLPRLVPRVSAAILVIAAVMILGILPFLLRIVSPESRSGALAAVFATHVAIVLGWFVLYLGYQYLQRIRRAEAGRWAAVLAARDAELRALRAQLNPHFLFNSLNSLRSLVVEEPARAREAVTALAALLRYTLRMSQVPTTTLGREAEIVQDYLDLEALRFEARLRYTVDLSPDTLTQPVPPMLLQSLVENAIKHGVALRQGGGTVRIESRMDASDLLLRVTNTGTLGAARTSAGDARGIGLDNAAERLRHLFGERARLTLTASGPHEVTCEVLIPATPGGFAGGESVRAHRAAVRP